MLRGLFIIFWLASFLRAIHDGVAIDNDITVNTLLVSVLGIYSFRDPDY